MIVSKILVCSALFLAGPLAADATPFVPGQKLEAALVDLIKSTPNEKFDNSLRSENTDWIRESGNLNSFTSLPPGAKADEYDQYGQLIAEPVPLFSDEVVKGALVSPMTSPHRSNGPSGVTLYKNDVFAAGFYYQSSDGFTNAIPMSALLEQPWFEFDYKSQKYIYRTEGAQEKIISTLDKSQVSLFHGGDERDAADVNLFSKLSRLYDSSQTASILKELQTRSKNTKYSAELQSHFKTAAEKLKQGQLERAEVIALANAYSTWKLRDNHFVFFGTEKSTGIYWNKGFLVEVPIGKEYLTALSVQKKIYVGIENNYIEVALTDVEALTYMLLNGIASKVDP